jgi:WD40 repeat protein
MIRFKSGIIAGVFAMITAHLVLVPHSRAQEVDLENLWTDLADQDAAKAYRAIGALALTPVRAVPFLHARLKPVVGDRKQIDKLIRALDDELFPVREKAIEELERWSDGAEEALKQALVQKPGLERKRRIEALLARIPDPGSSPTFVRQARALEALEWMGTREAQELLERLAKGNAAARWTQMAKESHARLARVRPTPAPKRKTDDFADPLPVGTLARLGTIRMQSGYWPAITPDGKTLVTVSDTSLQACDLTTGRALPGFPQSKDWPEVRALAISPNGKFLAVAYNRAYSFDICEFPSGKLLHQNRGTGETFEPSRYTVAFSSDSKNFIVTSQFATQIGDVTTGKKIREFNHPNGFFHAVISADGRRLATSSRRGIWVWDVTEGKLLHDLGDQKAHVFSATINSTGTRLATYGEGPSMRIWDIVAGKLIRQVPLEGNPVHGDPVPSFAFSPDGTTLALIDCFRKGDPEQRIQLWNLADPDAKPRILIPPPGRGAVEGFTPDGKTLLWRTDSSYRLLDSTTGKDRHEWVSRGAVLDVAWSPDGTCIASAAQDGAVGLWDAVTGKPMNNLTHRHGAFRVVFSADSKLLVSCGGDTQPANLWDVASGRKKAALDVTGPNRLPGVIWAGFSRDGKFVYTAGYGHHGIFDTETGKLHSEFDTERISTWNMAFSADGQLVALGINAVSVFDLLTKKRLHDNLQIRQCVAHAFSHDGRTLAAAGTYGEVILWELLTGRERARFAFPPKSYSPSGRLAFSPDNRMLAAVGHWRPAPPVQVWDLATRQQLGPFPGHLDSITAVAFSPDSRLMATASRDGTVLIREVRGK